MNSILQILNKTSNQKCFPNKRGFLKKIKDTLAKKPTGNYEIICANVASFRLLNEKFGMEKADDMMTFLAEKLDSYSEKKEGIICYYFTDEEAEFAMFCDPDKFNPDVFLYDLDIIFQLWSQDYKVTVKLGLAELANIELVEQAISRSKMAVESIKDDKNTPYAYFSELLLEKQEKEQNILKNLNQALLHGEIIPYFQPQFDTETKEIVGAEMFARWMTQNNGMISPMDFIPVLEKNGLDTEVDMYLWGVSLSYLKKWRDKNYNLPHISLNVSSFDFFHPEIVEYLVKLIKKNGLETKDVHIEISGLAAAESYKKFVEVLKKFIDNGFTLEIGNFGSDQTSLKLLMDVPVSVVKLDRSIIQRADNERGIKVLSSIVSMVKDIGLKVTTEGVETESQFSLIKSLGCDVAQGYYFSKPANPDEFESQIKA